MNPLDLSHRLAANANVIETLVADVTDVQAKWRPAETKWSMVEVICHLADEEREDFRRRLDLLLHHPESAWPSIDPESWARERRYRERDLKESLRDFRSEREASVSWIQRLEEPDWNRVYDHHQIGSITAGSLLASWIAHDFLHVRQLTALHYGYLRHLAEPHRLEYAGEW